MDLFANIQHQYQNRNSLNESEKRLFRFLLAIFCVLEAGIYPLNHFVLERPDNLWVRLFFLGFALVLIHGTFRKGVIQRHWNIAFFSMLLSYTIYLNSLAWEWQLESNALANSILAVVAFSLLIRSQRCLLVFCAVQVVIHPLNALLRARPDFAADLTVYLLPWTTFVAFVYVMNRSRIQQQLLKDINQNLLDGIYHHSNQALLLVNAESNKIVHYNSRASELFLLPQNPGTLTLDRFVQFGAAGREEWKNRDSGDSAFQFECHLAKFNSQAFHALVIFESLRLGGSQMTLVRIEDIQSLKDKEDDLLEQKKYLESYSTGLEQLQAINNLDYDSADERYGALLRSCYNSLELDWAAMLVKSEQGDIELKMLQARELQLTPAENVLLKCAQSCFEEGQACFDLASVLSTCSEAAGFVGLQARISVPLFNSGHLSGVLLLGKSDTTPHVLRTLQKSLAELYANSLARALDLEVVRLQRARAVTRHQHFFELSSSFFCILDNSGCFLEFNSRWQQELGLYDADLQGAKWADLFHADDQQDAHALLERANRQDDDFSFTSRIRNANQELIWVRWELHADPREKMYYVAGIDISARLATENKLRESRDEAHRALKAKSEFLAMMSHEIRTPMNGVIGMTNLLMETPLNGEQLDFVDTIQQSGETLLTVINDILDFSKIEAGRVELEVQPVEIRTLMEDVIDLLSANAAQKQIELLLEQDVKSPTIVMSDPVRLRQILLNLMGNAIKFTEKGFVSVSVTSKRRDETGRYLLHFAVKDSGIGIAEDKQKALFSPFTQADASTTRRFGGTGLGLSISRSLVELMEGDIGLSSVPGEGSVFYFDVPMELSPGARELGECIAPELMKSKRIQLVGSPDCAVQTWARFFQTWGANCTIVPLKEEEQFSVPDQQETDLVLLFRNRAIPAGMGKLDMIRSFRQEGRVPVIHLCGGTIESLRESQQFGLFAKVMARPSRQITVLNGALECLGLERRNQSARIQNKTTLDRQLGQRLKLRVLLVEDNMVNQKLALRMLEKMGFKAELAENGLEAFEMVQAQAVSANPYNLIFMDMQMPVMDGLESTQMIRQEIRKDMQPVIIAMTANAMKEDQELCLEAGMNDFIAKPINTRIVQDKIRHWGQTQIAETVTEIES